MARKLQLGALILSMLLVGVSQFVPTASAGAHGINSTASLGTPIPGSVIK